MPAIAPYIEPPLAKTIRGIQDLVDSPRFGKLPKKQQQYLLDWLARALPECAIEMAILRSSDKQRRFMDAFFNRRDPEDSRPLDVFVALGGNRSGKSFSAGVLCFAQHLRDHARDGGWYWCVAQTLDRSIGGQQQELWRALPRWMFRDQAWDEKGGFGSGKHGKLVLPTADGGTCLVEFRSSDQALSTFEQAKLDGCWIDEKTSESVYGRLIPRVVDKDGFILYSDIPEQFWQITRLKEAPPEAGVYFQHFQMADNAHNLPDGAIVKASAKMSEDERAQKIRGEFLLMEGLVYGREYIDPVHGRIPFKIPASWPKWRAIDYGSSAPTACLWFTVSPDETIFIYREYYTAGLSISKNAKAIVELSGNEVYAKTFMDPHSVDTPPAIYGTAKTVARQYEEGGIKSTGWPYVQVIGEHAMVQRVKFLLENKKLFVFTTCTNTRREFRSWKHKLDKEGRPLAADAYENENNHALDCIKGFVATNPTFVQRKEWEVR